MRQIQDSIPTLAFYPKMQVQKTTTVVVERPLLEERELHRPTYDVPLLYATLCSFCLLFFIYIRLQKMPINTSFLSSFFHISDKEERKIPLFITILQHCTSFILLCSLSYFLVKKTMPLSTDFLWIFIALILLFYIVAHYIIIFFTGYIMERKEIAIGHYKIIQLLSKSFGILVFPLLVWAVFGQEKGFNYIFYALILILFMKMLTQFVLIYKLLQKSKFSIFHSFLYLCTLEILPIVYIVMIIKHLIKNN